MGVAQASGLSCSNNDTNRNQIPIDIQNVASPLLLPPMQRPLSPTTVMATSSSSSPNDLVPG